MKLVGTDVSLWCLLSYCLPKFLNCGYIGFYDDCGTRLQKINENNGLSVTKLYCYKLLCWSVIFEFSGTWGTTVAQFLELHYTLCIMQLLPDLKYSGHIPYRSPFVPFQMRPWDFDKLSFGRSGFQKWTASEKLRANFFISIWLVSNYPMYKSIQDVQCIRNILNCNASLARSQFASLTDVIDRSFLNLICPCCSIRDT